VDSRKEAIVSIRSKIPVVGQLGVALVLAFLLVACEAQVAAPPTEQPGDPPREAPELTWELDGESLLLRSPDQEVGYLVIGAPAAEPDQETGVRVVGGQELSLRAPAAVYEVRLRLDCPPGVECNPCLPGDDCPPVPPPPVPRLEGEVVLWLPSASQY
jgi:hypothetical protein